MLKIHLQWLQPAAFALKQSWTYSSTDWISLLIEKAVFIQKPNEIKVKINQVKGDA